MVLAQVLTAAPVVDVLVVDDNIPDGTAGLVTAHPAHRTATVARDVVVRSRYVHGGG